MTRLTAHPSGHYHFLPGIAPYSCGVVADKGHEIIRVSLQVPQLWRNGFDIVDKNLRKAGHERSALCAMELRSPQPFTIEGFIEFNRAYCAVLEDWNIFVDGVNPVARTNVCPLSVDAPDPVLHAFSFVRPNSSRKQQTFVVAGAGELLDGILVKDGIWRCGETSGEALAEKARYVCDVMADRLQGLAANSNEVTTLNAYTVHNIHPLLGQLLDDLPAARRCGICWHYTRPPVIDIEFEMDMRGILAEESLS